MVNLKDYKLQGTMNENVVIVHRVKGCLAYKNFHMSHSPLQKPTMADAIKWIEQHEKEHHTPKPLTQEQKIESRKRWDAAYDEAQKRNNG